MSFETLQAEIQGFKTFPAEYILELEEFMNYLKLKAKFENFENDTDFYKNALLKWRNNAKPLFENPMDASFLEHAFENIKSKEIYEKKDIWE